MSDRIVAYSFGKEWSIFRQGKKNFSRGQRETIFENYFRIFLWNLLPPGGGVGIKSVRYPALVAIDAQSESNRHRPAV